MSSRLLRQARIEEGIKKTANIIVVVGRGKLRRARQQFYISGPFGFSTTASYLSRPDDHGQSFHLVPGNLAPYGKPLVTCVGGGDSAQAVDSVNRFYFADLQGLTDVSNSISSDEGTTWLSTCNAANDTGVDRPWIAAFGDPQNGGALYQTVDETEQCVTPCGEGEGGLGQVGGNIVEITRSRDGVTFTPLPAQQIEPDGIVSGIVTDSIGGVYIAHTGFVDPATGNFVGGSDANGNDNAIVVVRFPNGYNATTPIALTGSQTCARCLPPLAPLNSPTLRRSTAAARARSPSDRISAPSPSTAPGISTWCGRRQRLTLRLERSRAQAGFT